MPDTNHLPTLLTPPEVASWLTITTRNVLKMAEAGDLPGIKLPNGDVVFEIGDLAAWLNSRKSSPGGMHA